MDIRTKLIFALVSVSLASMLILGLFVVRATTGIVEESAARRLEALAESKQRDLEKVVEGWRDRLRLVSSRTQLRVSLRDHTQVPDPQELARIQRILGDALSAVDEMRRMTVYDALGQPVATQGESQMAITPELVLTDGITLGETFAGPEGVEVSLRAPLRLDGQRVGAVEVVQVADEIENVTGDYTGLERTGEAYVVMRDASDEIVFLNDVRHVNGVTPRAPADVLGPHVVAALEGEESLFLRDLEDYRGEPVWAATRALPWMGWALVVKMDAAEARARAIELRDTLVDLSLALAAFAIVGGTLLGLYLARPLRELAEVVARVRKGETDLRAQPRGSDEVCLLGRAINELLDDRKGEASPSSRDDLG
ncbi:MAG: HAMP domain-containing protein [Deltaproteobacteria bacterium]|jgi:HAMP domain-containing protein|nr:HAMP domain-containing protein [Deltaproteobacteria bacterium]MBW2497089.1 HAMP domain-containing protein [Deltaproteobacteria bacterium]